MMEPDTDDLNVDVTHAELLADLTAECKQLRGMARDLAMHLTVLALLITNDRDREVRESAHGLAHAALAFLDELE